MQVHLIQGGNFQFAAGAGLYLFCLFAHIFAVKIQAGNRIVALGLCGLFFNGSCLAVFVKCHHTEAFGIGDIVAEHSAAAGFGVGGSGLEPLGETCAVKNIIAQYHSAGLTVNKLFTQDKGLCQTVRGGLHFILQVQAVLATIPQQRFKARRIGWGGNDQDILDACQHQSRQRVIDHGLIIHRQKLLGCDHGQRVQAGTSTAGEDDTFHDDAPFQ